MRINDLSLKGTFVISTLSLVTTIFCYTKIRPKLRHQQVRLHNNVLQGQVAVVGGTPLNIVRY